VAAISACHGCHAEWCGAASAVLIMAAVGGLVIGA
jgi:hypothetical protein